MSANSITIFELDHLITFGKHKGKTVQEVMETAPGYIVWAYNNIDWFGVPDDLYEEACILSDSNYDERQLKKEPSSREDAPLFDRPEDNRVIRPLFDDPDDIPF